MNNLDKKAIGKRVRALSKELGYQTAKAFGDYLGAERGTVDAWFNGRSLIPAVYLLRIQSERKIPMEWVLSNDYTQMPYGLALRLQLRVAGEPVPPADVEEVPILGLPAPTQAVAPRPHKRKREAT